MTEYEIGRLLFAHDREIQGINKTQESIACTLNELKELHKEALKDNKSFINELNGIKTTLAEFNIIRDNFEERIDKIEIEHENISAKNMLNRVIMLEDAHQNYKNLIQSGIFWFIGLGVTIPIAYIVNKIIPNIMQIQR